MKIELLAIFSSLGVQIVNIFDVQSFPGLLDVINVENFDFKHLLFQTVQKLKNFGLQ